MKKKTTLPASCVRMVFSCVLSICHYVSRTQPNAIFDTHMNDLLCNVYNDDAIYMATLHTLAMHTYGFQLKLLNKREKKSKTRKRIQRKIKQNRIIFFAVPKAQRFYFYQFSSRIEHNCKIT